jgi:predicted porin
MHNKTLIALAIASAVAAPFAAHADVSIYGVADGSLAYLNNKQTTGSKVFLMSDTGSGGSRLGFNASQDIGGGAKVKANIEAGFALDRSGASLFGARQHTVGLAGGFGSLVVGQDYTLTFLAAYRGEYCGWCGIASPAMLTNQGVRAGNYVKYDSPSFGGFSFGLAHGFGEASTDPKSAGDTNEIAAFYAGGPVNVAGSFRQMKVVDTLGTGTETYKDYYLAGNVGFSIVKIYALLGAAKQPVAAGEINDLYTNLGVSLKVGGDLNFQLGRTKNKVVDGKTTMLAVSYFYPITKGATVYGAVASVKNESPTTSVAAASYARGPWVGTGANFGQLGVPNETATGVQVGLKYAF